MSSLDFPSDQLYAAIRHTIKTYTLPGGGTTEEPGEVIHDNSRAAYRERAQDGTK